MKNILRPALATVLVSGLGVSRLEAQALSTIHAFPSRSEDYPQAGLTISGDTLYGVTIVSLAGTATNAGTVYSVKTDGSNFKTLHFFSQQDSQTLANTDGADAGGNLLLSGNTLYGTAASGGTQGGGTLFSINTDGTEFVVLHSFAAADGTMPTSGLVLIGGTLYGTTSEGGANGNGSLFGINTNGSGFTNLYSFVSGNDAPNPVGGLVGANGTLFGLAKSFSFWTLFAVNTNGLEFTNLYIVSGSLNPGLILSGDTLYGTTGGGSTNTTVFAANTNGAHLRTVYAFAAKDDAAVQSGLNMIGDTLYGNVVLGGGSPYGTVFSVNTNGSNFSRVYSFAKYPSAGRLNEGQPVAGMTLAGGTLYGATEPGPSGVLGTIFKLALPYGGGAGSFNGLFFETNGVSATTSGLLKNLSVSSNGTYTGTLLFEGVPHPLSGKFDLGQQATQTVKVPAAQGGPLTLNMTVTNAADGALQVTGTVSGSTWTANLLADLAGNFAASGNYYTMLIPPDTNNAPPSGSPGGYGYALIATRAGTTRKPASSATIAGELADGTAFSETAGVSADGYVALYSAPYGNKGVLTGWINLNATNTAGSSLTWIHPTLSRGTYSAGFTNTPASNQLTVSPWSAPSANLETLTTLAVDGTNETVSISGAGKITGSSITGTVNLKNGFWTAAIGRGAGEVKAYGAILPGSTNGAGFYLTRSNSLPVQLLP